MTNPPPSPRLVGVLKHFYTDAGIDLAKAKENNETWETAQLYYLLARVSTAQLVAAQSSYDKVLKTFREALDLKVGIKNTDDDWLNCYIDIKGGVIELARIPQSLNDLILEITIDKSALIQDLKLEESRYTCFYYLFEESLVSFLSVSVLALDGQLFPEAPEQADDPNQTSAGDKPVVIVLSETEVLFAGEMLTIVDEITLGADPELMSTLQGQQRQKGASEMEKVVQVKPKTLGDYVRSVFSKKAATPQQARAPLVSLSGTLQEEIQKYRTAAIETPSLFGGKLEHLTPLHFLGQWRIKHSRLEKILAIHFLNICILYTANRSTFEDSKESLTSVYASADRTTTLSLREAPTGDIPVSALADLAKWLYGGRGTDRRNIFQNIVARGLANDDPEINYPSFAARAPQLLKDAIWQHQVFIDGKITKHFDELQKVIGYVGDINKKISEAIDSVTKSLTDALLATIGVLVLTVLAALVKKDTSIEIFSLSTEIYAWYVFIYAALRMGSIGHSYRLLSREASVQVGEYQSALQIDRITDLSSSLKKRRHQFHFWFWLTVVLYLALGGLILWAGKKGPQLLIDRGIITAPGAKKPEASIIGLRVLPRRLRALSVSKLKSEDRSTTRIIKCVF
jgi:hypothetical protein